MSVLEPSELEKSPLSDLHTLASELGIEGYRRLRKADLIAAIVGSQGGESGSAAESGGGGGRAEAEEGGSADTGSGRRRSAARGGRGGRGRGRGRSGGRGGGEDAGDGEEAPRGRGRRPSARDRDEGPDDDAVAVAEEPVDDHSDEENEDRSGILDILPNGSGFVRNDPFAHADDDVYVSPAQIRRCELRTGDDVAGPVRSPRRSERYPSLVRVETVNGAEAEPPAERPLFTDLTATFARERLSAPDVLDAVPFGKGSRVAVAGAPGAGATTLLRQVAATLAEKHSDVDLVVVLAGVRPEEVTEWRSQLSCPVVGGSFDESHDRQGEVASMAVERAKRAAERGRHAAVVVDSLDLLPPGAARRVFGAARGTEEAGSVTVIAATGIGPEHSRHATTRIVLRPGQREATVDDETSMTLRADLLS